jgi:hypothetical protein
MQTRFAAFGIIDRRHDVKIRAGVYVKAPEEFMKMYPNQLVMPSTPFDKRRDVMVEFTEWKDEPEVPEIRKYPPNAGMTVVAGRLVTPSTDAGSAPAAGVLHEVPSPAIETHVTLPAAAPVIEMPNILGSEVVGPETPVKKKGGRPKGSKNRTI